MKNLTKIIQSLDAVQSWVEARNYKGYEPFDGLSSPLRPLTFGNLLCERLLQQCVRQSPINIRPIVGIKPQDSTKGRGYMAWGYLARYRSGRQAEFKDKAEACLDWLDHHKAPKYTKHSWSNHFDFSSRGGAYTRHDPIIVWTALIGQAYLDAFDLTGNERWLSIADSICGWILGLSRERTSTGNCISYHMRGQFSIHNASMLGAAMLARCAKHTHNEEYTEVAASAMQYSCTRQLEDGSWWYAEEPKFHWIDNFHTGYNLNSLKCYIDASGDTTFDSHLRQGLAYYKKQFFHPSGRPPYYSNRVYPVDIQCAAQAIETMALFGEEDPECLELAERSALWTIENMQDRSGYFYYRQYPLMTCKTPMLHWGQGTMFKALSDLVEVLQEKQKTDSACVASR